MHTTATEKQTSLLPFPVSPHRRKAPSPEILRCAAVVLFATLLLTSGWAQVVLSNRTIDEAPQPTLEGVVTVDDQPADGASVQVQCIATGEVMNTFTMQEGSFSLSHLSPGKYLVTARLGLEQVQTEVSLAFGPTAVHLRIPGHVRQKATGATVSTQQLQVPAKARSALEDAQKAVRDRNLKRAAAKLEEALQTAPTFAEALALRAVLQLSAGDLKQALNDSQAAVRLDPNYAQSYFVLAAAMNQSSDFVGAAQAAQQGLRLEPRRWQGHFELGKAMAGQNQNGPAVKELTAAIDDAPSHFGSIHLVRAVALIRLGQYGEAEKDLREVVQRDPKSQDAATAHLLLPQVEQALASSRKQ